MSNTPAKIEALADADAHLNNVGMPGASEMLLALMKARKCLSHPGNGDDWSAACEAVSKCLKQAGIKEDAQ